jgi:hypothetical protein
LGPLTGGIVIYRGVGALLAARHKRGGPKLLISLEICIGQSYAQSSQVGVPPRGGGAGRRDRGQGGRGESYWNMVNLTM